MDRKERALVEELVGRVAARIFHERDVLDLLILLRRHAVAASPVKELGDFIAHREKDRGILKKYMDSVKAVFDPSGDFPRVLVAAEVFKANEFIDNLNGTLDRIGVTTPERVQGEDVLACALSLLQDIRVVGPTKIPVGRLVLARTDQHLQLLGFVTVGQGTIKPIELAVPVLQVQNRYCVGPKGNPEPFEKVVQARCRGKSLRLFVGGKEVP